MPKRRPIRGRMSMGSYRAKRRKYTIPRRLRGVVRRSGYYGRFSGSGGEKKFFDTALTDAAVAATMTINNLTIIPEGNGESDRIGRKITLKSVSILYSLVLPGATGATISSDTVRCMLVQDTQTNGAQFTATQLIDTDTMISFNNLANSSRFKVLYKAEYKLRSIGGAPSGAAFILSEDQKFLRFTKAINIPIEYDNSATTGVITSVRSNNLYWVTQAEGGHCTATGNARVRYTDR